MFSHITVGVSDTARTKAFYDAVFAPLGLKLRTFEKNWVSWQRENDYFPFFSALIPFNDEAPSAGNGSMTAFMAPNRGVVDASYAAAMEQGGACEGPPGPRPHYHEHYYGAYFRDPDGNKIHVVCHEKEDAA